MSLRKIPGASLMLFLACQYAWAQQTGEPRRQYFPVLLKCPDENGDTIWLEEAARDKHALRYSVRYKDNKIVFGQVEGRIGPEKDFSLVAIIDPRELPTFREGSDEHLIFNLIVHKITPYKTNICGRDPAIRAREEAKLKANRKKLGID